AAQLPPLKVIEIDPGYYILLVQGQLLPRAAAGLAGAAEPAGAAVEGHAAPALLTDVEGRVVFTKATKLFLIPASLVARARSNFVARPPKVSLSERKSAGRAARQRPRRASIWTRRDARNGTGSFSDLLAAWFAATYFYFRIAESLTSVCLLVRSMVRGFFPLLVSPTSL
ncbi:unnamed protein product, partial [Phaeothamnion confervicola]